MAEMWQNRSIVGRGANSAAIALSPGCPRRSSRARYAGRCFPGERSVSASSVCASLSAPRRSGRIEIHVDRCLRSGPGPCGRARPRAVLVLPGASRPSTCARFTAAAAGGPAPNPAPAAPPRRPRPSVRDGDGGPPPPEQVRRRGLLVVRVRLLATTLLPRLHTHDAVRSLRPAARRALGRARERAAAHHILRRTRGRRRRLRRVPSVALTRLCVCAVVLARSPSSRSLLALRGPAARRLRRRGEGGVSLAPHPALE